MMMRKLLPLGLVVSMAAAALLSQGCGPGSDTFYADFLDAKGQVYASNGTTLVADLPVDGYNWVVTFSDGSTVANPFVPTGVTTDAKGEFSFSSKALDLRSGNAVEYCDKVCIDEEIAYEDVCTDWEQSCGDEYCADWGTDSDGNEVCNAWTQDCDDYCANWVSQPYTYCAAYGDDCSYAYPSRSTADIVSAYSEITYSANSSIVTTASENTDVPATSLSQTSTPAGKDTDIARRWAQNDVYVTLVSASAAKTAKSAQIAASTSTPRRAQLTSARNAGKVRPARTMKHAGTPNFGRTHAPSKFYKEGQLPAGLQPKLEALRAKCNAYPKN